MEEKLDKKEKKLRERLEKINKLEKDIIKKETEIKKQEKAKKQILLRLSPVLWNNIAQMAEEDFRSINGEIEFLLNECVKKRGDKL